MAMATEQDSQLGHCDQVNDAGPNEAVNLTCGRWWFKVLAF